MKILKKNSVILSIVIFSSCFSSKKYKQISFPSEACVIPFEGLGQLKLGISDTKDILEYLGEPDSIKLNWSPCHENPLCIGSLSRVLCYNEQGLALTLFKESRVFSKRKLYSIHLDSTSNLSTSEGIGINSRFEDIKLVYGQEKYSCYSSLKEKSNIVSYGKFTENGQYRVFYLMNINCIDSSQFRVKKIYLN